MTDRRKETILDILSRLSTPLLTAAILGAFMMWRSAPVTANDVMHLTERVDRAEARVDRIETKLGTDIATLNSNVAEIHGALKAKGLIP